MATMIERITGSGDERFREINSFARHTPWLHAVTFDCATYGLALLGALVVVGWWIARRNGDAAATASAAWAAMAGALAAGAGTAIGHAVYEPSPREAISGLFVLARPTSESAFPATSAAVAGAIAAGLFPVALRLGEVAVAAAVVLAVSDVYTAAHYPHDEVVGLVLGAAIAVVGGALVRPALASIVRRLSATSARPLIISARRNPQRMQ